MDRHSQYMQHANERLNQINEWRNEAVKHAVTKEQVADIDRRAFEMREAFERRAND